MEVNRLLDMQKTICLKYTWYIVMCISWRMRLILFVWFVGVNSNLTKVFGELYTPYLDSLSHGYAYVQEGDINLGAIMSIHKYDKVRPCGDGLRETGVLQRTEAVAYAVQQVNLNPNLLKDVKLGFVILDDCLKPTTALAQSLKFMPMKYENVNEKCDKTCFQSDNSFYEVVGVIGAESSPSSIMIANLLDIYGIPQISPSSTSDLLSDKSKYPYFMRIIPPDRFQVRAILQLILHFNWTYISAVYAEGGYGAAALDKLTELAKEKEVCIGASLPVKQGLKQKAFVSILEKLKAAKAKVVVLFTDQEEALALWAAAKETGHVRDFVWVGSDGIGLNLNDFGGYEDVAKGALSLKASSAGEHEFWGYIENLTSADSKNPWFHEANISESFGNADSSVSYIMDIVYTYAHGLDALIRELCPKARGQQVRDCINTTVLLEYLKNVTFKGTSGNISFDKNGDMLGRYEILNYQVDVTGSYTAQRVGIWDASTEKLTIEEDKIIWDFKDLLPNQSYPESLCARPCAAGHIYSYFRDTCCWECRHCNSNEITAANATRCNTCPELTWPDQTTFAECIEVIPQFIKWHEPVILVLLVLSLGGMSFCTIVFIVFIRNNGARIIKATSRELSYIMLGGITIQYVLVFTFVTKPERFICFFNYIGFNVSFTVVYAPLLTRTNRIYRIFNAGKRTKVMPSFTSPLSQVVITMLLILTQIAINIVVSVSSPPEVSLRMPIVLEPYAERVCTMPLQGFATSLCYNILLVLICTIYAFKTRKLPDNFNESRYITLCVYTTLVIWLAFLPTYFTTSFAYYQVILITCALLFNGTVTVMCLYVPRIYALHTEGKNRGNGTPKYNIQMSTSATSPRMDRRELTPMTQNQQQEEQGTCTELSEYCAT